MLDFHLTPGHAGVDEVGRGPLVGNVVCAAVILPSDNILPGLTDSKKLTAKRREALAEEIKACAISWAIGEATVDEIDRLNILQATLLGMRRAVEGLSVAPTMVYVDGNKSPQVAYPVQTIVKGDSLVPAISAASILAKVTRDAQMLALDAQHPEYGFAQHKGYPTKAHLLAIAECGVLPEHRRSFAPVREALTHAH